MRRRLTRRAVLREGLPVLFAAVTAGTVGALAVDGSFWVWSGLGALLYTAMRALDHMEHGN